MPTITVNGKKVTVGDEFLALSPEEQDATVDEIASSVGGKSVGGFFDNVGRNVGKIAEDLSGAYDEKGLKGIAADVGKTFVGMGQQFIPGQQEWETQYADPLYKQIGKDLGFSRGPEGIGWSAEQLGKNLYERPVDVALSGATLMAPLEATPGRVGTSIRAVSRSVNPISLAGKGATSVAKRVISPIPGRAGPLRAANNLAQEGVRTTAGQATGSKALKYAESELGGGRTSTLIDEQGEQFTRAASRRIGIDSPHLDGQTMEAAYNRIGGEIGAIASRNKMVADNALIRGAYNAEGIYNRRVPISQRVPIVTQFGNEIRSLRGNVPGDIYQDLRSRIGREARATNDPHTQHALYAMQRALDDAMERSVSQADRGALATARKQYRNYLVLEDAMATGGQQTAAGILTPAKLEQAASLRLGRRAYLHGRGNDFAGLAKSGKAAMSPMPESGTSARLAINAVPAIIGGAIGGGTSGGMGAAAGALFGRAATGRALMSRPVQVYLRNQAAPTGRRTKAGTVVGSVGRGAATIVTRQQSLDEASNVISPKVMEHIKRSPNTRGALNDWLKARNSGQGVEEATQILAGAIVKELKIDDPTVYNRIIQEFNQAIGG